MSTTKRDTEPEPWGGTDIPRDFEVDAEDLSPQIVRAATQAARLALQDALNRMPLPANYGRHSNGEKRLMYWILGIFGMIFVTLLTMSVKGMWDVSGSVQALGQQVTDYHEQDAQNSERNHQDIQRINDFLEKRDGR